MYRRILPILPFLILPLSAQQTTGSQQNTDSQSVMMQILQRLDALERENHELINEVHSLKQQLDASQAQSAKASSSTGPASSTATVEDRLTVAEHRIAEQAQTKVEASQKFPISLNGMLLFNGFANSGAPEAENANEYGLLSGPVRAGATVRQTLLGFDFQGPALPDGGRINASFMMDFWGGSANPSAGWPRIRRADISLDWQNRTFMVGQDKPLISPYQPDSLAEVGIPPLAGAGNLWVWLPQTRYEERVHLGTKNGLTAQAALMQTGENYESVRAPYTSSLEQARPGLEGRLAFWHKFDEVRRFEIGSGFHTSSSHVAGTSVPSHIASLDWRIVPFSKLSFSGTVYTGQNVASLGALGNGFTITSNGTVHPVHSSGGWAQVSVPITNRLTINLFGGLEDDRGGYINPYNIVRNLTYASNLMYHLGPNVVLGLEALQMRTRYFSGITEIHNHYDVALGYLF